MSVEVVGIKKFGDDPPPAYNNAAYESDSLDSNGPTRDSNSVEVTIDKSDPTGNGQGPNATNDGYAAEEYNAYQTWLISVRHTAYKGVKSRKKAIYMGILVILTLLYFAYFGYAMYYRFGDEGSWRLLVVTVFAVFLIVLVNLCNMYSQQIDDKWDNSETFRNSPGAQRSMVGLKWILRLVVFAFIVIYIIVDVLLDHPENMISIAGLVLYIIIFYITSINPAKINWHTVFWGMALQYLFALMILRTQWGYEMFKWLGDRVTEFLNHTFEGIKFLFGNNYEDHFFAMQVLPIVIFFFTFINILYYLGVMQAIIKVLGKFLSFCMGTSPAESINAAANIFVSMTESPLMIRPFLDEMTKSELHAVMTGGFATIAGSVLGAYISFGVPANHLLSASVMSAPAALAISKLAYPETKPTKGTSDDFSRMQKAPEHNVIEAASNGATNSIKMVGAIAVNVLAFLSLKAFLNATLMWFGDRVGVPELSFEFICSYLLFPVSFFMGVETGDCRKVAELIGVKTFTNEFIAYQDMAKLLDNRQTLLNYTEFYNTTEWSWQGEDVLLHLTNQTLVKGFMSVKSEIITTYALCGFANFGSVGIMLGGLGALAPSRKTELSQMVVRAMICGNVACFLTACIAGLLYKPF